MDLPMALRKRTSEKSLNEVSYDLQSKAEFRRKMKNGKWIRNTKRYFEKFGTAESAMSRLQDVNRRTFWSNDLKSIRNPKRTLDNIGIEYLNGDDFDISSLLLDSDLLSGDLEKRQTGDLLVKRNVNIKLLKRASRYFANQPISWIPRKTLSFMPKARVDNLESNQGSISDMGRKVISDRWGPKSRADDFSNIGLDFMNGDDFDISSLVASLDIGRKSIGGRFTERVNI